MLLSGGAPPVSAFGDVALKTGSECSTYNPGTAFPRLVAHVNDGESALWFSTLTAAEVLDLYPRLQGEHAD